VLSDFHSPDRTVEFHLEIHSTPERQLLDPLNVGSMIHPVNLIVIEMGVLLK